MDVASKITKSVCGYGRIAPFTHRSIDFATSIERSLGITTVDRICSFIKSHKILLYYVNIGNSELIDG